MLEYAAISIAFLVGLVLGFVVGYAVERPSHAAGAVGRYEVDGRSVVGAQPHAAGRQIVRQQSTKVEDYISEKIAGW